MVLNPFLEGLLLIIVGIVCMVLGSVYKIDALPGIGNTLLGVGIGYVGGTAVQKSQP